VRLVVDIGNSAVHAGLGEGGRLLREARLVVDDRSEIASFLDRFLRGFRPRVRSVGVASVAPAVLETFDRWSGGLRVPVLHVGRELPVPLDNPYGEPSRLGVDRLVAAHAVRRRFDGDWVVIDFGTAVTVDAVTAGGAFHAGAILPGLWLSLESLTRRAAQLVPVIGEADPGFPARSTEDSMCNGALLGLAGAVDRLARDLAGAAGIAARAVATGGDAARIAPHSRVIREVVPGLTLLGLLDLVEDAGEAGGAPT